MGIIDSSSSIRQFSIEQFVPQQLVSNCYSSSEMAAISDPSLIEERLWKPLLQPFLRHTVKGIIWHQGT